VSERVGEKNICNTIKFLFYFRINVGACTQDVAIRLEGEQQEEGHHKTEETHGFGQSESQNGV